VSSIEKLDKALIEQFASGGAILRGQPFALSSGTAVAVTAATGAATHIALDAAASSGLQIRGVALGSPAVVMTLVGTGDCTEGLPAVACANGATDVTLASVTGAVRSLGIWRETGVVSDMRPLYVGAASYFRAPAT
jgi:hypothetical protein